MRTLYPTLAAALAVAQSGCGRIAFDARPDARGAVRSTLVLDRVAPGQTLVDFPLPVTLDDTRADVSRLTPETLRVFDGDTELAVDVESRAGQLPFVAWVRVPQIRASAMTLTVEYGGEPRTLADEVWDANYLGVWHLNHDAVDASLHARASTMTNVGRVVGMLGGGAHYEPPQGSCIVVPSFSGVQLSQVTLSAWIRLRANGTGLGHNAVTRQFEDMPVDDFILSVSPSDRSLAGVATVGGGSPTRFGTTVLTAQAWHHIALAYTGATSALYVDGVADVGGAATGVPYTSARPLFIGCGRNSSTTPIDQADESFVDGDLDEVRIEAIGRSSAWMDYTVRAHRDEVITYGGIEP